MLHLVPKSAPVAPTRAVILDPEAYGATPKSAPAARPFVPSSSSTDRPPKPAPPRPPVGAPYPPATPSQQADPWGGAWYGWQDWSQGWSEAEWRAWNEGRWYLPPSAYRR